MKAHAFHLKKIQSIRRYSLAGMFGQNCRVEIHDNWTFRPPAQLPQTRQAKNAQKRTLNFRPYGKQNDWEAASEKLRKKCRAGSYYRTFVGLLAQMAYG